MLPRVRLLRQASADWSSYCLRWRICVLVLSLGLTDRSQPIRSSACSADAADVELVSQQVATRPDISQAVGVVSRFMHNPNRSHWNAVKHVFRYLASTKDYGILFGPNSTSGVVGYTDSDFADCVDSHKSTTGYWFRTTDICSLTIGFSSSDPTNSVFCVWILPTRVYAHYGGVSNTSVEWPYSHLG